MDDPDVLNAFLTRIEVLITKDLEMWSVFVMTLDEPFHDITDIFVYDFKIVRWEWTVLCTVLCSSTTGRYIRLVQQYYQSASSPHLQSLYANRRQVIMSTAGGASIPPEQLKARYLGTGESWEVDMKHEKNISGGGFCTKYFLAYIFTSSDLFLSD